MRKSRILVRAAIAALALIVFAEAVIAATFAFAQTSEANQSSSGALEIGGLFALAAAAVAAGICERSTLKQAVRSRVAEQADLAGWKKRIAEQTKFLGNDCYVGSTEMKFPSIENPVKDTIDAQPTKQAHENSELTTRLAMAS
jgi:hypothetical protein